MVKETEVNKGRDKVTTAGIGLIVETQKVKNPTATYGRNIQN